MLSCPPSCNPPFPRAICTMPSVRPLPQRVPSAPGIRAARALLVALAASAVAAMASAPAFPSVGAAAFDPSRPRAHLVVPRQSSTAFAPTDANQAPAVTDALQGQYVQAAEAADAIPGVQSTANGNLVSVPGQLIQSDGQQYPWNANINVTQDPAVNGSEAGGWQQLPPLQGFTFNETFKVYNRFNNESAVFPYYISVQDPATVERFIVVLPGKVRQPL